MTIVVEDILRSVMFKGDGLRHHARSLLVGEATTKEQPPTLKRRYGNLKMGLVELAFSR